ncbi:MAG: hypothetical protein OZ913_09940, partial [Ignavibacteriaceae bacterium]|nr:hypothetical protein [Ignavibacteriaceae bacterium]
MKKLLLLPIIVIIAVVIGFNSQSTNMDDDPNLDRIPSELLNAHQPDSELEDAVWTDEEGFDNYFLGIDFAEAHISMNPNDPKQMFVAFNTNGTHYTLNGIDWATNMPNFGTNIFGDPITAYDSLGRLYYENMSGAGGNITGTRIISSDDNAQTWRNPVNGNIGVDKNWMAADQTAGPYSNYVYSVFTAGGGSGNIVRSIDRGNSFNFVTSLSTQFLPGMMVAVGPNGATQGGTVYVVTNSGNSFAPNYTFYKSENGGTTFNYVSTQQFANYVGTNVNGRHSVENMRTRPYPYIAADNSYGPHRGRLYLIYASNNPPGNGNNPNIYCRYSDNQGATWSGEVLVNDNTPANSSIQFHPAMWCDKETGRLYVQWMDTRNTPTNDSAEIYASYSDNGGVNWATNQKVSNKKMKIECTSCGGGGTPRYQGDYNSVASNSITSIMAWADFRSNNFSSYVAYFPDYAMKISDSLLKVNDGQNANITVSVPAVKLYDKTVTFTGTVTNPPSSGNINITFPNGNTINSYPGQVTMNIAASGGVTPGSYTIHVEGRGPNGTPAHRRELNVLVNASLLSIQTNRGNLVTYTVNGNPYNSPQQIVFPDGANVTVETPLNVPQASNNYMFTQWSNGSTDTTLNFTINQNTDLTAHYKRQYLLLMNSSIGNTFGGDQYYDSNSQATFGVLSRIVSGNGLYSEFKGWIGGGPGSYSSPDSSGMDTVVTVTIKNPIVETARWYTIVGISNVGDEIPEKYDLSQNYPNPFNPVTNIRFDIMKAGNVKLSVYDITGKEVSVL